MSTKRKLSKKKKQLTFVSQFFGYRHFSNFFSSPSGLHPPLIKTGSVTGIKLFDKSSNSSKRLHFVM